jgi:hypothetical protein
MQRIKKMNLYQLCAERLNAKGVKPFSAREWTLPIVQQTVYGKVKYPEVMEEIKLIIKEHEQSNI